jgi:hypothetical protein
VRKFRLLAFVLISVCCGSIPTAYSQMSIARSIATQTYPPTTPCYAGAVRFSRSNNGLYLCGPNSTWTLLGVGGSSPVTGSGTAKTVALWNGAGTLTYDSGLYYDYDINQFRVAQGSLEVLGPGASFKWYGGIDGTITHLWPDTITSYSLTWPAAQGGASTVLTNNGSGGLSWAAGSSLTRVSQGQKTLTDNTATSLVTFALTSGSMSGGTIQYLVESSDGTELQSESGSVVFSFVNKSASYTTGVTPHDTQNVASSGTLAVTWDITTGTNLVNVRVNANTSLTPTTLRITYVLTNLGQGAVTLN